MFNSLARQDEFVLKLLNFKENGFYIDIGSHDSKIGNNTFAFQSLNWIGMSVELESQHNNSYTNRVNNTHFNNNALLLDYTTIFKELNFPKVIDYLSLDIDTLSLSVLDKLPFNLYNFSIITIEHDAYLYGDTYRLPQRSILKEQGYDLICSNVFVEQDGFNLPNSAFEDWYIKPEYFDINLIERIKSESEYPSNILKKF
jgi:hypothetical protein